MARRDETRATRLSMSPELQGLFRLVHRMAGRTGAQELGETCNALVTVGFKFEEAALILGISSEVLRQRVHRIKGRAMEMLKGTSYVIPEVRNIEDNLVFGADDRSYQWAAAKQGDSEMDES